MSTPPEKIIANYDSKSKQSKIVAAEMKKIVDRYKDKRITKENVCVLVSTLMLQANNLKTISGPDKKELVQDLIFSIIEQIDEGETDSEFETLLKAMVPGMIDSFALMLKTSAGCKKLFGCFSA
uniref:Uncharacterized protein n=1 Tax=Bathycoccus sp. RCC716 virus 2 TaxID=2530039 RepID=A0A7S6NYJ6_9PHYC|nr:hypothetical protein [Bathycoccus sp. RCC716 virus 2]|tara:strand:+ start:447 stop:818 length:372 start_codon:yes stop_codon:yes gene_type:complete